MAEYPEQNGYDTAAEEQLNILRHNIVLNEPLYRASPCRVVRLSVERRYCVSLNE